MDEEELDYTEMWDEIKSEWNKELFYNLDEDETEDEETEEEDDE